MDGALETLTREFAGLRTGRAHPALLEPVKVHAYGNEMPLNQVGTVACRKPRMLTVQVWDQSLVAAVEKAIRDAGLGLNPASDGSSCACRSRSSPRNAATNWPKWPTNMLKARDRGARRPPRRHGADQDFEKKHEIGEDPAKDWQTEVQKLTDQYVKKVDDMLTDKEKDIRQV